MVTMLKVYDKKYIANPECRLPQSRTQVLRAMSMSRKIKPNAAEYIIEET